MTNISELIEEIPVVLLGNWNINTEKSNGVATLRVGHVTLAAKIHNNKAYMRRWHANYVKTVKAIDAA